MTIEEWQELTEQDEHYAVNAIKRYLLTPEQRIELFKRDLSIEDILNGRTYDKDEKFIQELFIDWNQKLGWNEFS